MEALSLASPVATQRQRWHMGACFNQPFGGQSSDSDAGCCCQIFAKPQIFAEAKSRHPPARQVSKLALDNATARKVRLMILLMMLRVEAILRLVFIMRTVLVAVVLVVC